MSLAQFVVMGLLILSAAITFLVILRYFGLRAAALTLGLYLPLILAGADFRSLDNPNLYPFPVAVYYAAMLMFAELRKAVLALIASVALAIGASAYVLLLISVPFHVALVALWARRPFWASMGAIVAFAIPFCVDSMDAARVILTRALSLPSLLVLVSGVLAIAAAGGIRAIRRAKVIERMSTSSRIRAFMATALVYSAIVVWLACIVLGVPLPPESRYFAPALFPLLCVAADSTRALGKRATVMFVAIEILAGFLLPLAPQASVIGRTPLLLIATFWAFAVALIAIRRRDGDFRMRSPAAAITLLCFALGVTLPDILQPSRGLAMGFSLKQGEAIVSALYSAGYSYPQIVGALQGPTAELLLPLFATYDPALLGTPPRLSEEDLSLLLLKVPPAAVANAHGVVAAAVERSQTGIVVRGQRSFLDWLHADICALEPGAGSGEAGCMRLLVERELLRGWPYIQVGHPGAAQSPDWLAQERLGARATFAWYAGGDSGRPLAEDNDPLRVIMAIRTPGHQTPHIVRVGGVPPGEVWSIVRVTGVDFEGTLPGEEILLLDTREASGAIEIEVSGVSGEHPWNWLRHVIEVTQDNAHLLDTYRGGQ